MAHQGANLAPAGSDRDRFELVRTHEADETDAATPLDDLARDVRRGLSSTPKWLSCRFLYDKEGSILFERICDLPDYYLTRADREILQTYADEIIAATPSGSILVELGSGSSSKTRHIIEAFLRRDGSLRYVPLDISEEILEESSLDLIAHNPGLEIRAIAGEYRDGLEIVNTEPDKPKLVLWLGSNLGNYIREDATVFLREVRKTLAPHDRILVGVDLRKDRQSLEAAYDDSQGVTAQFNLNLLARINRELGGEFDAGSFRHRAVWNDRDGRMEISLVSRKQQSVRIRDLDLTIDFEEGEDVHTEYSYKYSLEELRALAEASGFRVERQWFDRKHRFTETLLAPTDGPNS